MSHTNNTSTIIVTEDTPIKFLRCHNGEYFSSRNLKYHIGRNVDPLNFDMSDEHGTNGLYFTTAENADYWDHLGDYVAILHIPREAKRCNIASMAMYVPEYDLDPPPRSKYDMPLIYASKTDMLDVIMIISKKDFYTTYINKSILRKMIENNFLYRKYDTSFYKKIC